VTTLADRFRPTREEMLVPFGKTMVSVVSYVARPERASRGTVFCFHDFTGNSADYSTLAQLLAANGLTVVCPSMIGRGESGYFPNARQYTFQNICKAAATVVSKYRGTQNHVVATGWGGLIALTIDAATKGGFATMVLSRLSLRYTIGDDPVIANARSCAGRRFASAEEAALAMVASNEFRPLGAVALADYAHRIRRVDNSYALNFDDAIISHVEDYVGHAFEISRLFANTGVRYLLLKSPEASTDPDQPLPETVTQVSSPSTSPGFGTPAEQLMVLGFLLSLPRP
jgi:pimeloyl-ACP methyl ester carboxylesterase